MRNDPINWARQRPIARSSDKFILVTLANRADRDGICYPSHKSLASDTALDIKTVALGLARLRAAGEILDTGERKGPTNRVVVWRIPINEIPPKSGALEPEVMTTKTGALPANVIPPFFPPNPPVFPVECTRFSRVIPPKTGDGITIESPIESPGESPLACSTPADLFVDVPKPPEKPTRQKRSKPRSAIPPDWTPDATGVIYATERGVDVLGETPRFVDYHLAKGSLMADWPAAWRTWVGNAVRFGKPKPRVAPPDITASFARFMRPASDEPPDYCTIDVPATAYSDVE